MEDSSVPRALPEIGTVFRQGWQMQYIFWSLDAILFTSIQFLTGQPTFEASFFTIFQQFFPCRHDFSCLDDLKQ